MGVALIELLKRGDKEMSLKVRMMRKMLGISSGDWPKNYKRRLVV